MSVFNTGVVVLGNATHGGSLSVGNANFKVDTGGNITNVASITDQGALNVTGLSTLTGGALVPNNVAYESKDTGGTVRPLVFVDTSNNLVLEMAGNNQIKIVNNAGTQLALITSGAHIILNNNQSFCCYDTDGVTERPLVYCDSSGNQIFRAASSGHIILTDGSGTEWWDFSSGTVASKQKGNGFTWFNGNFIPEISFFTGTTTGTFTHSFNGSGESITPFFCIPICDVSGSQTMGYDSATTSQVHITSAAGLGFKCMCV